MNDVTECIRREYFLPKEKEKSRVMKKDVSINNKKAIKKGGIYYPLDIWFILANYIKPEQIHTFSCICRGSYQAITSRKFWMDLYKRYITDIANLPVCLKPNFIANRPGLKTRIVRALFFAYPNLNNRVLRENSLEMTNVELLHQLIGLRCHNTWYKIESTLKSSHTYIFRFQVSEPKDKNLSQPNDISSTNDHLNHNDEEDYIVLQVKVQDFTRVQFTADAALLDFSMDTNLTTLKMVFGCLDEDDGNEECIVLKSVRGVQLLRWWHPSYPHRD
jgi:hypothetical protein